jgi:hypothetical protein
MARMGMARDSRRIGIMFNAEEEQSKEIARREAAVIEAARRMKREQDRVFTWVTENTSQDDVRTPPNVPPEMEGAYRAAFNDLCGAVAVLEMLTRPLPEESTP